MNTIIVADCLICAAVVMWHSTAHKRRTEKTEIKAALTYLTVVLLLVLPLLIYQCQNNKL